MSEVIHILASEHHKGEPLRTSRNILSSRFDAVVVGLGAMGAASMYQLAKRGIRVLGIDQFSPPHAFGSSHGDTRTTREAICEAEELTPFAMRSHQLWRQIESETGRDLLTTNGWLMISSKTKTVINHVPQAFERTIAAAKKYQIPYETLDVNQIRTRYPEFKVQDDEFGYFEPGAGFLRPEECIRAQLELAQKYGAEIHSQEKVLGFDTSGDRIKIDTDRGTYIADKLILSAGPWMPEFLGPKYAKPLQVKRQVLYWFDVQGPIGGFLPERFPTFVWELKGNKNAIYGFPALDGPHGGIKIATEQYDATITPDTINRTVTEAEIDSMHENFVAPYLPALGRKCLRAVPCMYTVTPDAGFIIDSHPESKNIIIASPCSGHGFKHSAAIGQTLSELVVDGKSSFDLSKFKLDRFSQKP